MKTIMLTDETIYRGIQLLRSTMSNDDAIHDGLIHTLLLASSSLGMATWEETLCPTHGWVFVEHACPDHDHTGE